MARHETVNISMPAAMRDFVRRRMADEGFGNVSEYFRHLVRLDRERALAARLEALAAEGLRSKGRIVADDTYWARKRQSLAAEVASGGRSRKKAG
jgi:antitoxin ParD1/3/4